MKNIPIFLLLLCFSYSFIQAQSLKNTDRSLLTILVIPYTGSNNNVSNAIENGTGFRDIISQINQAFEDRGYRTKDYMALLNLDAVAPSKVDLERDVLKQAIKNAKVDIVIYMEVDWNSSADGDRQLHLRLQAIDKYTAENYANNASIESNRRYYQKISEALNDHQLKAQLEGFVNQMDRKFIDLLTNGRTMTVKILIKPECKFNLESPVDNSSSYLGAAIERWVQGHVAKIYPPNYDETYWEAECKLLLVDAEGKRLTPSNFRSELKSYLSQLTCSGIPIKPGSGTTINAVVELILE
ncbi:MAG: DUF6175 family protein [Bacteroidetes bacterium]|nr:DUF6175 family protein [Bacteroidota bacterium]